VENGKLYLAFPEGSLSPARWEVRLREEMGVIENLLRALEEPQND
jgi:hypothetical protein